MKRFSFSNIHNFFYEKCPTAARMTDNGQLEAGPSVAKTEATNTNH